MQKTNLRHTIKFFYMYLFSRFKNRFELRCYICDKFFIQIVCSIDAIKKLKVLKRRPTFE